MPAPAATTDELSPAAWVAAVIRARIAEGTYRPGSKLPAQHHIGDELDVSGKAMTEAFAILAKEGLVDARKLVGTIVLDELPAGFAPPPAPARPANLSPRRRKVHALTEDEAVELAAALRATRKSLKMSQAEAAADAGVAKSVLAELEKGYLRNPAEGDVRNLRAWIKRVTAELAAATKPEPSEPETQKAAVEPVAEQHKPAVTVGAAEIAGPGPYFLHYTYLDEDEYTVHANTVVPLPDEPTTLTHIRSIEASITASLGHEGVVLAGWRRMGASMQ